MDPNTALADLRDAVGLATALSDGDPVDYTAEQILTDMTEAAQALDDWLSKDGFLPTDWLSDEEKADPGLHDRNALIVGALRELPWGEDVDINGGDLVQLVGLLLTADGRDTLTALRQRAAEEFNPQDDEGPLNEGPLDWRHARCWKGNSGHHHLGCPIYADGTITDPETHKVLHDPNGA